MFHNFLLHHSLLKHTFFFLLIEVDGLVIIASWGKIYIYISIGVKTITVNNYIISKLSINFT